MANSDTPQGPILVPVDFSPSAAENVIFAAEMAQEGARPLIVLHVIHDRSDQPGFYHKRRYLPSYPIRDRAHEMMDRFLERVWARADAPKPPSDTRVLLIEGIPATRIAEIAEREGVDTVVFNAAPQRGLLYRNMAQRVVNRCSRPLQVVRPQRVNPLSAARSELGPVASV